MREINRAYVDALKLKRAGAEPKPFPGRWPTRLWARWREPLDLTPQEYLGKPCDKVLRALLCGKIFLTLREFDRKSLLINMTEFDIKYNNHLIALYHPTVPERPLDSFSGRAAWDESFRAVAKVGKFVFYGTGRCP